MRKVEDYRKHAEECRMMMARSRSDEERQMLQTMAETWESLAREREHEVARRKRLEALEPGGANSD